MDFFIRTLFADPFTYLSWVFVVAFSICFHEYAHARVAYGLGDDTGKMLGHLSLNPMVQMGPVSLIILAVFGIAWGSTPVNTRNLRARWGEAVVAFAGPASNLLLCLIFSLVLAVVTRVAGETFLDSPVARFLFLGCVANGVLFLFNMLPIPILDGWSVFSLVIPGMRRIPLSQAQNASWIFFALVFMTPIGAWIWSGGSAIAGYALFAWHALFGIFG